ncbi:MAG: GNAT family N-acetyltransferase [Candidatus Izemoplasmatales bacterium]|nr:GNAT family N-acetyltransferase [Candidatus Izemoplasmatales bacterium]
MITKAQPNDLEAIAAIARRVVVDLHASGIDQWSDIYPLQEHFQKDMDRDGLFVYKDGNRILGSISILPQNDPFYKDITWLKESSLVVHRLMVDPIAMKHGIGSALLQYAIDLATSRNYESIKVDTHPDNFRMQGLLLRHGFVKLEMIERMYRIGFELVLTKKE